MGDNRTIAAMSKRQNSTKQDKPAKSGSAILRFFLKAGIFFGGLALCGVLLAGMAWRWPGPTCPICTP